MGIQNNQGLIEHWNGTQWSIVSNPASGIFLGVASVSTSDVWTVGFSSNSTFTEHWNGTGWSVVPSPNVPGNINELRAVSARSSNDVWAVGDTISSDYSVVQTLIEHWDGTQWSIISSLNVMSAYNSLYAVTAISSKNAWAVGAAVTGPNTAQTLIENWNGTSWKIASSPSVAGMINDLFGIAAVSPRDIWATGILGGPFGQGQTLIEHWDGTSWKIVSSPNVPGSPSDGLNEVTAVSAKDVWTVGSWLDPNRGLGSTLIEHWNGTTWSIMTSPDGGMGNNELVGVARVPGSKQVWAVGDFMSSQFSSPIQTLTEVIC